MRKKLTQFNLKTFLQKDVKKLNDAHQEGKALHPANISDAGHQVEQVARELFRSRLPNAYAVDRGHIVDSTLSQSSHIDVIIANLIDSQALTEVSSLNKYIPYEAVYAMGEIKSSYSKSDLAEFVQKITDTRSRLVRRRTHPDDNKPNSFVGPYIQHEGYYYSNPLFTFMLVVDGKGFKISDIEEVYKATPVYFLPTVYCLLNHGTVIHVSFGTEEGNWLPDVQPEILPPTSWRTDRNHMFPTRSWQFLPQSKDSPRSEANLAVLYSMLLAHLRSCTLEPAPLSRYLQHIFDFAPLEKVSESLLGRE